MASASVGDTLGRYRLVEEIGQGGMSVVFRAQDEKLKRDVAVKVMHGFLASQQDARERFRREAVAVASLKHPHIIEIYDYSGEDTDLSFIVAELVIGQPLSKLLQEQPIAIPEMGLALLRPLAAALVHAHEHGVIHRDLKPENVLVGQKGRIKLTDFGIAKMLDNQTLTVTGALLGSPAYMAPEYIEGHEPDARADIFSFGAMLYQTLVGKLPFEAPSPHALLKRIAAGNYIPANQQNPNIHSAVARLIHHCLETDPQKRIPDAPTLLAAVDDCLSIAGLGPSTFRRVLEEPQALAEELRQTLPEHYFEKGKEALAAGAQGQALEHFDRVLALEPDHAQVRALLSDIHRSRRWRRGVRTSLLATTAIAVLTGTAVGIGYLTQPYWQDVAPRAIDTTPDPSPSEPLASVPPATDETRRNVPIMISGQGDIFVDGTLVRQGASGPQALLLAPGDHNIQVKQGALVREQAVTVPPNGLIAPLTFDVREPQRPRPPRSVTPPPTRDVVFNARRWVTVFVDGASEPFVENRQGRFSIPLTHGEHRLRFVNDFAKPYDLTLQVDAQRPPGPVVLDLEPKDGRVLLVGGPKGDLQVRIGDRRRILTDLTRSDPILVPLKASRTHEIVVEAAGYKPMRQSVTLTPGKTLELAVKLEPL